MSSDAIKEHNVKSGVRKWLRLKEETHKKVHMYIYIYIFMNLNT